MSTKKIILFSQDGVGGAEKITSIIGNQLYKEGNKVLFCLVNCNNKKSISGFLTKGVRIIKIFPKGVSHFVYKIFTILHKEQPDVVFSSVLNINNKVLLLKPLFPNTKFIIRCDTNFRGYKKRQLFLIKLTYTMADLIIAQTNEMKEELTSLLKIDSAIIKVLPNPIDEERITDSLLNSHNPYNTAKKHIVAVGRFRNVKGFDLLLEAFIILNKRRNDLDLYFVGDYTSDKEGVVEQLRKRIQEESIEEIVHFTGFQTNPYSFIKFADCFALSSRWEGLPNVVIESLYIGTPVVAFNCIPVIERIINEGVNGYIVPNGAVKEFADALNKGVDMGEVKSIYIPSEISDFTRLF